VARRRATTYDKTIEVMHDALNGANIGRSEKVHAFRRLAEFERRAEGLTQTSMEGMQ
jgi:hypothetical protein